MTSQIFKTQIPNALLNNLLEENAFKSDKCYIVNNSCL
jgi:hypothetical protein